METVLGNTYKSFKLKFDLNGRLTTIQGRDRVEGTDPSDDIAVKQVHAWKLGASGQLIEIEVEGSHCCWKKVNNVWGCWPC